VLHLICLTLCSPLVANFTIKGMGENTVSM
jgi:hypothetical protein